ncbi:MAG: DUF481 domain-containing protein [Ignavibacteria bacterium]|nr:DUF481 domain-containing protein [Ignavibacteria bacterium]
MALYHRLLVRAASTLAAALVCISPTLSQTAQDTVDALQKSAVKIFIDCGYCDEDYIRTEITFVNYVRDRTQAHVHIMITEQYTGSGGIEYTLTFIGQHDFAGMNDTLRYVANKTDTQDMTRKGLVRVMKTGLLRYAMRTPFADYFNVTYNRPTAPAKVTDKWDYWVFSMNMNSWLNGESQYKSTYLNGGITASRVTEDLKLRFSLNGNYSEDRYEFSVDENTVIRSKSVRRSQYFNASAAWSLSDHWSVGIFGSAHSSTYSNIDYSASAQPAIEYNIFPYSESTRRQLRISYKVGISANKYVDTTIYFKKSELLQIHNLSVTLTLKQPWGSWSTSVYGSQYFHDLSKNNLSVSGSLSLRIFEGLSFNLYGGYSAVHDQLSLTKRALTVEEVYQRQRQLETSYSYWGSIGLSYTFGSIFSNIVNPRFGTSGSGGTTVIYSD